MIQRKESGEVIFSVIVPVYQIEDCLEKCIDSLLQQTFQSFELLLIDDGSTDQCPKICEQYAKKDSRVKVIHKQNGGLVSARNVGIRHAQGEYICYVDGDDWVEPVLLETMYHVIRNAEKPDMVVFQAYYAYPDRQDKIPCYVPEGNYDKERLQKEIYPYMIYDSALPFFSGRVYPAAWNKIYKRELLQQHYCRDERISIAEDNAFVFECLYYADTVYFIDKVLYHYNRCRESSMVSSYNCHYFEKIQLAGNYLESHLANQTPYLKRQINVFQTAWLIMAVFHEVRFQKTLWAAKKRVAAMLHRNGNVQKLSFRGIPVLAKGYLLLIKMNCSLMVCILAKILVFGRKGI